MTAKKTVRREIQVTKEMAKAIASRAALYSMKEAEYIRYCVEADLAMTDLLVSSAEARGDKEAMKTWIELVRSRFLLSMK